MVHDPVVVLLFLGGVEFLKDAIAELCDESLGGREVVLSNNKDVESAFHRFVGLFNANNGSEIQKVGGDDSHDFVFVFHSFLE